jgi:protoheme ferro-lyase
MASPLVRGGICGCLGCSNRSGGLLSNGFTQKDWEDWKVETGFVDPVKEEPDFSKLIAHLKSVQECRVTVEDPPEYVLPFSAHSVPVFRERRTEAEFYELPKED